MPAILIPLLLGLIVFVVATGFYLARVRGQCGALEHQIDSLHAQVERKTERIRDLLFDLEKARAAASAPLPPTPEPLDAEDFRAAFDVDPETPLWQAVHQLLDAAIVKGVETVEVAPSMSYGTENRTHAAGELSALRDLQKDLLRWHREARRAKAEA